MRNFPAGDPQPFVVGEGAPFFFKSGEPGRVRIPDKTNFPSRLTFGNPEYFGNLTRLTYSPHTNTSQ